MFKNFEDLHKAYGFDDDIKSRTDLTEEQEINFVNDCYDTYEYIGFAETFKSPYEQYKPYNGQSFEVLERVLMNENNLGFDLEQLPVWKIRFVSGFETFAYPEEICLAERK